jgi:iron complex transport system ATP-binding protein
MADPLIELHDASVVIDGARILDALTLTIDAGDHTAILGPNGAGKSTLMKLLALELYPEVRLTPDTTGDVHSVRLQPDEPPAPIRLFGRERWDVSELRAQMGIVSADLHDRFVHGNSNGSITAFEAALSGFFATQGTFVHQHVTASMRDAATSALERVGAAHLAHVPLDRMSTGEARRVLIARALVRQPRLLVLDEPTRGLDLVARHQFMERVRAIAAAGTTLLLVTHYVDEIIPEIDRVVLLERGRIAADGAKRDVLTAERLGSLFGAPLAVAEQAGYFTATVSGLGPRGSGLDRQVLRP